MLLERHEAVAVAKEAPAGTASSSGAAAIHAPKRLADITEYVCNLSASDRSDYFTKQGMRDHSKTLDLRGDMERRPHDMAVFLFWDVVSRESKEMLSGDVMQYITPELQTRVCGQASMDECWIRTVEHQLAPLTSELWAHLGSLRWETQKLALNVLAGIQAHSGREELSERNGMDRADVGDASMLTWFI
jgi:hypothetical protein